MFAEKRALLSANLEKHKPDIVALTETWFDDSVEISDISGYNLIFPRDRVKARTILLNYEVSLCIRVVAALW